MGGKKLKESEMGFFYTCCAIIHLLRRCWLNPNSNYCTWLVIENKKRENNFQHERGIWIKWSVKLYSRDLLPLGDAGILMALDDTILKPNEVANLAAYGAELFEILILSLLFLNALTYSLY